MGLLYKYKLRQTISALVSLSPTENVCIADHIHK